MGPRGQSLIVASLAFLARLIAIPFAGPGHFWSYPTYYRIAQVLVSGGGYCLDNNGGFCARFPPVYPTLLAACILTGHPHAAIRVMGCLIGAGTAVLVRSLARLLFDDVTGLVAGVYAAVYPYFVWHDTVVQETGTLAFIVTATLYALCRLSRTGAVRLWFIPGVLLGLDVLTKVNLLLFVPAALGWVPLSARRDRVRRTVWALLGVLAVLGPWAVRTWRVTGEPFLDSDSGKDLFISNNALFWNYFPARSTDEATAAAFEALSPSDRTELRLSADRQGRGTSHWLWNKGMEYIETHPAQVLRGIPRKLAVAFSPIFSPAKPLGFQTVYFAFFFPLLVLAPVGACLARDRWRELGFAGLLILTFAMGTAVFWAHTSHRMYVEPVLIVLASSAAVKLRRGFSSLPTRYTLSRSPAYRTRPAHAPPSASSS